MVINVSFFDSSNSINRKSLCEEKIGGRRGGGRVSRGRLSAAYYFTNATGIARGWVPRPPNLAVAYGQLKRWPRLARRNHPRRGMDVTQRRGATSQRGPDATTPTGRLWTADCRGGLFSLIIVNMRPLETMSLVFEASIYDCGNAGETTRSWRTGRDREDVRTEP